MTAADEVRKLMSIRAPLWARVLGAWRCWRRHRAARQMPGHVGTLYIFGRDEAGRPVQGHYICKEDSAGERTFEFWADHASLTEQYQRSVVYVEVIAPWRRGELSNTAIDFFVGLQRSQKAPSFLGERWWTPWEFEVVRQASAGCTPQLFGRASPRTNRD